MIYDFNIYAKSLLSHICRPENIAFIKMKLISFWKVSYPIRFQCDFILSRFFSVWHLMLFLRVIMDGFGRSLVLFKTGYWSFPKYYGLILLKYKYCRIHPVLLIFSGPGFELWVCKCMENWTQQNCLPQMPADCRKMLKN